MKRLVLGILLAMLSLTIVEPAACNLYKQQTIPKAFRLLAVEGQFRAFRMQSGQCLIQELLRYSNWNNVSNPSRIHLLSRYTADGVFDECKPSLVGNSTKANMKNEIQGFLADATSDELAVLYFNSDGLELQLFLDEMINSTELLSWLNAVKTTICIIIDACHSGSWVDDGSGGVLTGKLALTSSRSNETSGGRGPPYYGVFTGQRIAQWPNGSMLPLGIIGGLAAGKDSNGDGWISFDECFQFAKTSMRQFGITIQNPVSYNGLGFDPPFVLKPQPPLASFDSAPRIAWINETINFNASTNNGIINYTWNFGDGNITSVSESTITHEFTSTGNYTITLNVTDSQGLWNTTYSNVTVTYQADFNKDRIVNILDVTMAAAAYQTRLGDPKWNELADLDKNGQVNILDVTMVAKDYGKTA